jgi:hypothetical protein
MLCHMVLTACNSLGHFLIRIDLHSKSLCKGFANFICLAHQQLLPALEHQERNFNTPRICRVYENTREPDYKGVKEGEALRRVRTGADSGLARWGNPRSPNRVICQKARLATSPLQPRILRNL